MSYIPHPPLMPPLLLLSPWASLPPPTPSSSLSTPWACKHTAASSIGDVHSGASSLLLPPSMPPLSLSGPHDHLPLLTPLLLLSITQDRHGDAAAYVVVPESLQAPLSSRIPLTHRIFLILRQHLRCCCQFHKPVSVTPPTKS